MRLLASAIVAALLLLHPAYAQTVPATITILHFNDVYEIAAVEGGKAGGLARVARLRATLAAQHPGLITTLGGDYVSPSALGIARVNGEPLAGKQMVAVLNLVGVDWATFGNHEFDIGDAGLRARLTESKFRTVSSNVTDANGALFPNTVRDEVVTLRTAAGIVRIGLIGLTIDVNRRPWVRYAPAVESARSAIADLKGRSDVIVALTHLTLAGDQELAEQVPEIDLILGGHEHENWLLERGAHFTPIVKADSNVRTVAIVTLQIPRKGARPIVSTRLQGIDETMKEGPRTSAEVRRWTDLAFAAFRKDGFDPTAVVATSDVPLDGRESSVRNRPTNLTALIVDAMRHEAGTQIGIFNGGSVRIDDVLPPGPITQYDVIRVLPFGGTVVKATFTGALLARVLQIGEQNRGTGGYLHSAGVPAAIDPAARYTLALSDFLLTGGEANLGFLTRHNPEVSDVTDLRDVRMALMDELKRRFPASPKAIK